MRQKKLEINIFNNYGDFDLHYEEIVKDIQELFNEEYSDNSLSLILVNLNEIHKINYQYRNLDRPTDVISFEDEEDGYLGDIFICIEKVYEQAEVYGHSKEREFAFLLCHGILHLLGYDHINDEDAKIMFAKQDELLNKTKYKRG